MEIPGAEVFRYLGYRGAESDLRVSGLVKELSVLFEASLEPKRVYGIWDCKVDSTTVTLGTMIIKSEDLARRLEGCSRAALLAATLGREADTLIRRCSVQDMEKAVIAQAVCTAMIEAYCDKTEEEIAARQDLQGLFRTKRFSPGYGDFDIACQKDIVNALSCDRKIGLTLTSACMLAPSKSVTAVIGFAKEMKQNLKKCRECAGEQCEFRENE